MKNGAFAQSIYKQSVNKMEDLDTVRVLEDGRMFAYARAGAVALAPGKLTISPVPSGNANNEALSATQSAAIGATSVIVTFGGAVTADYYADGWFWVNDATGEGHLYRIKSHPAGTADVTLELKDSIRVALVASTSEWSAIANRQNLVVLSTFAQTGCIAGVPPIVVDINYYFWNQVKGPAPVLADGTLVIGDQCGQIAVAGAVTPLGANDVIGSVGTVMSVNVATEYALVNLAVPGY
ncbi:MAG: hypothetical protein ABIJ57_09430 [Pseudomonadota bacterium]|uniref:Uncharacterized protein n=1 Tax=viral metagenome TaxID=1070528 RepID=A0A6M3J693_9ZZZZ